MTGSDAKSPSTSNAEMSENGNGVENEIPMKEKVSCSAPHDEGRNALREPPRGKREENYTLLFILLLFRPTDTETRHIHLSLLADGQKKREFL